MALGTIAAGVGLAGSAYSGYQAYQSSKDASKSSKAYGAISSQTADVMQKQYEKYKSRYVPLEDMFISEANEDVPETFEDQAKIAGSSAYADTLASQTGQAGSNQMYGNLAMAGAEFPAQQTLGAFQGAEDEQAQQLNKYSQAVGMGRQIPQQVIAGGTSRAGANLARYQSASQNAQSYGQGVLGIPAAMINNYSQGMKYGSLAGG